MNIKHLWIIGLYGAIYRSYYCAPEMSILYWSLKISCTFEPQCYYLRRLLWFSQTGWQHRRRQVADVSTWNNVIFQEQQQMEKSPRFLRLPTTRSWWLLLLSQFCTKFRTQTSQFQLLYKPNQIYLINSNRCAQSRGLIIILRGV